MTDFCYSRPMLNHVLQQAATMDRMMAAVGVAPAVAARVEHGTGFYEARTRCIECRALSACKAWLATSQPDPAPPPFCPNRAFFAACLEQGSEHAQAVRRRAP